MKPEQLFSLILITGLRNFSFPLCCPVLTNILSRQPELTVENLPSFLSLGKALLMLFVGEEEDAAGLSQNQALLREMKTVVELGRSSMDQYLASWVHLCVHPSSLDTPVDATPSAFQLGLIRHVQAQ